MEMKKHIIDLQVTRVSHPGEGIVLLWNKPVSGPLPDMVPGQFAQLSSPVVFLRRPISIHDVDKERGEVAFLVQAVGDGTRWFQTLNVGDTLNAVLPLGRGFSLSTTQEHPLLVGGGVGVAPLLFLGRKLKERGIEPTFLLGARTASMLLCKTEFEQLGRVFVTTEDGSEGERGFVTQHSILQKERFTLIQTCGPSPMMKAVGRFAQAQGIPCEVSLENRMACGIGACLCCVQQTREGHKCVCTDGPVFDYLQLIND